MLSGLTRTASGRFKIADSVAFQTLSASFVDGSWQGYLLPVDFALGEMLQIVLDGEQVENIRHGRAIPANIEGMGLARGLTADGRFIAILSADLENQVWQPKKVFHSQIDPDYIP
jgi:tRNA U55 pseudouridine synthase TruB